MAIFRDPNAPAGRVVFGGTEFVDGVTADIEPGPDTLRLFQSASITTDTTKANKAPAAAPEPEPEKPARKK